MNFDELIVKLKTEEDKLTSNIANQQARVNEIQNIIHKIIEVIELTRKVFPEWEEDI
jgi:hypothetical protein